MQFELEFGDSKNRMITLSSPKFRGIKIRGAWRRQNVGPEGRTRDIGEKMGGMPDIPGQRLRVDVKGKKAVLTDPIGKYKSLRERVFSESRKSAILRDGDVQEYTAIPDQELEFTDDEMKSLLVELARRVKDGSAKTTRAGGRFPSDEQIEKLPGRELFDTRNNSPLKPTYKDEYRDWAMKVDQQT